MKLPRNNEAVIPEKKITHYLLSDAHPLGRAQAKYFKVLGYNEENAVKPWEGLLAVAAEGIVAEVIDTPFGAKYVVDGDLMTPVGVRVRVRTIWVQERGQSVPRFVTAYPKDKQNMGVQSDP